jgi:FAD/FMN-containing dehydrogenase
MNAIPAAVLDELRRIVGPRGWASDPADVEPYLVEWRGLYRGAAPLVLKPASTAEVAAIVAHCRRTKTPLVPQGGNTSLVGGSIPFEGGGEVVLSLSRLNRVRAVDALNDTITVEAGCVLADVQAAAAAAGRLFPLRIASESSCQIGGNLSTNAGGNAVLRYGSMRDLTLGLEVVLADGRVWDGLRGLRKDNTGYDVKHWFIGAEGTLGVITAAVLKLFPQPQAIETAFAAVPGPAQAVELLALAKAMGGGQVSAFEIVPRIGLELVLRYIPGTADPLAAAHGWYVLLECTGGKGGELRADLETMLGAAAERGLVLDATIAASAAQAAGLWKIRENISAAQKFEGGSIKCDIAVPVSRVAEFIARAGAAVTALVPGTRVVAFGHIGDGNIHFNPLQPAGMDKAAFLARWDDVTRAVHDLTHALGGSISAEHGVGRLKREEIRRYKAPVEIELMAALKRALDPDGILNPGKLL